MVLGAILIYVLEETSPEVPLGCGSNYQICMTQAEDSHALRMGTTTAAGGLGMAIAGWTGIGAAGAAGGWVIGMVGPGIQYEIDSDACYEYYC